MVDAADTEVDHPLAHMLAVAGAFISADDAGQVEAEESGQIPPAGLHRLVGAAALLGHLVADAVRIVGVSVGQGDLLDIAAGVGLRKLELERDTRGNPLTDTDAKVRRDRSLEGAVVGEVAAEAVRAGRTIEEPVPSEGVGHHSVLVQRSVLHDFDRPGLESDRVAVHLPVVFVLFELTPHRCGSQQPQGEYRRRPANQMHFFHNGLIY